MSKNELYKECSERAMNMFGKYIPNSYIDSDVYASPYRDMDITFLTNWIPVVMKVTRYDTGSLVGWIPCLLRKAPDIKREPRGYMEFNGITSMSEQYIEDLEFAISSPYLSKLIYYNTIDRYIDGPGGKEERPTSYNNVLDSWKTHVNKVDIKIYPYFFEYGEYMETNSIKWINEQKRIGIYQEDYSNIEKKGLPNIKLNNVVLGEKIYGAPIELGYNHKVLVNFISGKVLDSHYEITYDKKSNDEKSNDEIEKHLEEFFVDGAKEEIININAKDINDVLSKSIISVDDNHSIKNEKEIEIENDEMLI